MAKAPAMALATPPPGGGPAGGMGADPTMGGDPSAGGDAGDDSGGGGDVIVTICSNGDGSYTVYPGDEPSGGGDNDDTSEDDADAMGPAGGAPAPGGGAGGPPSGGGGASQGVPADSIGAALKAALDILNADKSSEGAPGNADDQFQAGFGADKNPTPASGPSQKY